MSGHTSLTSARFGIGDTVYFNDHGKAKSGRITGIKEGPNVHTASITYLVGEKKRSFSGGELFSSLERLEFVNHLDYKSFMIWTTWK